MVRLGILCVGWIAYGRTTTKFIVVLWQAIYLRRKIFLTLSGGCRTRCRTRASGRWILQHAQLKILITFCTLLNLSRIIPE